MTENGNMMDVFLGMFFFVFIVVSCLAVMFLVHLGASAVGRLYMSVMKLEALIPYEAGEFSQECHISWHIRHQSLLLLVFIVLMNIMSVLIVLPRRRTINVVNVMVLLNSCTTVLMIIFPLFHATVICNAVSTLYIRLNAWLCHVTFKQSPKALQRCGSISVNAQHGDTFSIPDHLQQGDPFSVPTNVQHCDLLYVFSRVKAGHEQVIDDMGGETEGRESETEGRVGEKEAGRETSLLVEELERCRQLQGVISTVSEDVCSAFTPSLMVVVPTIFIYSCYVLYGVYPANNRAQYITHSLLLCLYALGYLYAVYVLSAAVDYNRKQHERTGELVHKCRADSGKVNIALLSSVQLFSLQLLHSIPQLRVAGFFSIDRSFMLAMLNSLATYLVILVQFKNTSCASDNTTTVTNSGVNSTDVYKHQ